MNAEKIVLKTSKVETMLEHLVLLGTACRAAFGAKKERKKVK